MAINPTPRFAVKESDLLRNLNELTSEFGGRNPHLHVRSRERSIVDVLNYEHTIDYRIAPVRGMYSPDQLNELVKILFPWTAHKVLAPTEQVASRESEGKLHFPKMGWSEPIGYIKGRADVKLTLTDAYQVQLHGNNVLGENENYDDLVYRSVCVRVFPDPNILELSLQRSSQDFDAIPLRELRTNRLWTHQRMWRYIHSKF